MSEVYARIAAYAALVLVIFFGGVYLEHKLSDARYEALELKDAKAAAQAQAKADAEQAELISKANTAEANYETEHNALLAYAAANPLTGVRLCIPSTAKVPATGSVIPGAKGPDPTPGAVLQVPSGDSGIRQEPGPDIGNLLGILADKADELSAKAREQQQR